MKEELDPKLKAKWNKKLREAGMPARIKSTAELLVKASIEQIPNPTNSEKEVPPDKIELAQQAIEKTALDKFDKMTETDSDRNYTPELSPEEQDRKEAEEIGTRIANRVIKKGERSTGQDMVDPEGVKKYKN